MALYTFDSYNRHSVGGVGRIWTAEPVKRPRLPVRPGDEAGRGAWGGCRAGPDRPRLAAAAAPHPPAPERVVGVRDRRALALPARPGRDAPGRRVGPPPLPHASPAAPGGAVAGGGDRNAPPCRPDARRRSRALRTLLRRALPLPLEHRPRAGRSPAHPRRPRAADRRDRRLSGCGLRTRGAGGPALGRVPDLARGPPRPGGAGLAPRGEAAPAGSLLRRQHGLRASRLLHLRGVHRAGGRAANTPLLARVRDRADAAQPRRRGPLHVPDRAPLPLSPGLLPPDGAADRPPAPRDLPRHHRSAAGGQPAGAPTPLPEARRVAADVR